MPDEAEAAAPTRSRWQGMPMDERRAARSALLVTSAYDLAGDEATPGLTVRNVCQRAGLHPRYFYESFEDLDDLAAAVYDHVVAGLVDEVTGAVAAAAGGSGSRLRAAIGATVRYIDDDRRRGRVLYLDGLGNETLNRRRVATGRTLVAMIESDAGGVPSSDPLALMGAAVLVGGLTELLVAWLDGRLAVPRDRLVADATALFQGLRGTARALVETRDSS